MRENPKERNPEKFRSFMQESSGKFRTGKITLSGKDGADAKGYQEKEVLKAIEEVRRRQNEET
jgi:hypothetical protein